MTQANRHNQQQHSQQTLSLLVLLLFVLIVAQIFQTRTFAYERETIDITGLETGLDVQHTHILVQKNDETNHWSECIICHKKFNIHEHNIVKSGSEDICNSWVVESCQDCGYEKNKYHVGHKLIPYDSEWTNTATYWHTKYICENCGQITCEADDGTTSVEYCTDQNGNRINCANRKKCVVCGYDYSKQAYISHATVGQIYGAASEKMDAEHSGPIDIPLEVQCRYCGATVYKVLKTWAVQSKTDNKHWDFYGIYQLYSPATWNDQGKLVYTYGPEQNQAFSKTNATVQQLPQQYRNKQAYNTRNIRDYSNIRLIKFSCDIVDGYQGTPYIRLNADNLFKNVNGNENEYAKSYDMCFIINPDCTVPQDTEVTIQTGDTIDNWTNKVTIAGKCTDNYSDIISMYITDKDGNKLQNTLTVKRDSSNEFKGSIDFSKSNIEIKSNETFYIRFEDRYGNIATKEFKLTYIDTKSPDVTSSDKYGESNWKNKLSVKFTAIDNGVGGVQIGFNNEDDYDIADEVTESDGTRAFERWYDFIGDTYSYVTPAVYYKDALGNTTYKLVQLHKFDNTKPTVQDAIANYKNDYSVKIYANDINKTLGEGSHVQKYMIIQTQDAFPSEATDSRWKTWTGGNPEIGKFNGKNFGIEDTTSVKQEGLYNVFLLDNADNISFPTTIEVRKPQSLFITATPDNTGYGSVMVDWSTYDWRNKNFIVYRSDNGVDYESIGIDYRSISTVRVLHIYPDPDYVNQMKDWVETQGYGKGIIKINSVSIEDFNSNPLGAMKDQDGLWKYDVIIFGTKDGNNAKDISASAASVTKQFIETGHGVIFGHDTVGCCQPYGDLQNLGQYDKVNFNSLIGYTGANLINCAEFLSATIASDHVKIQRSGLFTNYPWQIGYVGDMLTIPAAHPSGQYVTKGTIWLEFEPKKNSDGQGYSYGDPRNSYLFTYNNVGVIQTGHSGGAATSDEQKILTNLMFYCNQLIFNRYNNKDYAAQDDIQPDNPQIVTDKLKYNIASKDNGRHYYFKVDAYTKDGVQPQNYIETSNIAEVDVITGLKGYHYVIDTNADTEVTRSDAFTTDTVIEPGVTNYVRYLHVAAIDNAGNISGTTTVMIPAELTISYNKNSDEATGTMDNQSVQVGQSIAAKSCEFSWDKHRFVRWSVEKDGSGKGYYPGDLLQYDILTPEFGYEMTLYAVWEPLYMLRIDPAGGKYNEVNGITEYWLGQSDTKEIEDSTRLGYNFSGWTINIASRE